MANPDLYKLSDRSVFEVTGEDAQRFLQNVVTQDVDALGEGDAAYSALLTPQGKILFDFFLYRHPNSFLVECASVARDGLIKRLTLYKLRAKALLTTRDDLSVYFSTASDATFANAWSSPDPRLASFGARILAEENAALVVTGALEDYHARRIKTVLPEGMTDFEPDAVFAMDVNYDALNGVDYRKGCFIGQEVASRMKRKSEARKRAVLVEFDGEPLTKDAVITGGEVTIGSVASSARGCAIALVRLDRMQKALSDGANPTVDDRPVRVIIPPYLDLA